MRVLKKIAYSFLFSLITFTTFISAQDIIEVGSLNQGEVDAKGFQLLSDGTIKITGYNAEFNDDGEVLFYGWIINSQSRELVWDSIEDTFDDYEENGISSFEESIDLKKGDYEAYYIGIRNSYSKNYNFGNLLNDIFGSKRKRYTRRNRDKLKMELHGDNVRVKEIDIDDIVKKYTQNSIVSINRVGDDDSIRKTFSLKKETTVKIYTLGEGESKDVYDYAWIYNADSHEKVWTLNYRNSDHAGGAKKNIYARDEITLPAGNYVVNYVTDDSHSYEEWNAMPPTDPLFYGITVWPVDKADLANIGTFEEPERLKPVVEMIRIRDDEYVQTGLKVKKEMDIRILCVGEEGYSKAMVDYGWIIDADTKEIVWEMEKRDSDHAGGARKNRMIDDVFTIDPGNYIVYYTSDDSHSYRHWNDTKPYEPEKWGITIWAANNDDRKYIESFDPDEYKSENVLVEIVRVRDNKYLSKTFKLDKETEVRIIAIGEGERRDMADYGWIDNEDTGRNVWEMTYRKTEHAGGASKNRLFNGTIVLPKGTYKVYYETDGSHSYRDWNSSPPRNPERYGITILIEK